MIKQQKILGIALSIFAVALLAVYFIFIGPLLKEAVGDPDSTLQIDEGEVEGANDRVMLFEYVERANMSSIEVHNEHGTYSFIRNKDGDFVIKGLESVAFDPKLFSTLVVDCGYTLSYVKVANKNPQKLSDYGLDDESSPAYYILTTKEGKTHKVYVGDKIPSNSGYYVRYEGRNTVYVLNTTIETTVLAPIEDFIVPTLIFPTTVNTYNLVDDFIIYSGAYWGDADNGINIGDANETKKPIVRFHKIKDSEKHQFNQNETFYMQYPGDGVYTASGYVDAVAQQFVSYKGLKTVKVAPVDEDLKKYGILDAEYTLLFINNDVTTENGKEKYTPVPNLLYFSKLQSDEEYGEYRYVYSVRFGIIAIVGEYDCEFLTYTLNKWVTDSLFSVNIDSVAEMKVQSGKLDATFTLEGSDTNLVVTDSSGKKIDTTNFRKFYQSALVLKKGGFADLTEDEMRALREDDSKISVKFTVKLRDGTERVFRFYSCGVQSYYTIDGEGEFYVATTELSKFVRDAERVLREEIVDSDSSW